MDDRTLILFDVDGVLVTRTASGELARTSGSWELLSHLQRTGHTVASVATDLSRDDVLTKLGDLGAGLARYLDISVAGFGTDGGSRAAILNAARRYAEHDYGRAFRTVAVTRGVASHVTAAASEADAVVAVLEAGTDATALRAAGAGHVVERLSELPLLLDAVAADAADAAA